MSVTYGVVEPSRRASPSPPTWERISCRLVSTRGSGACAAGVAARAVPATGVVVAMGVAGTAAVRSPDVQPVRPGTSAAAVAIATTTGSGRFTMERTKWLLLETRRVSRDGPAPGGGFCCSERVAVPQAED